MENKFAGGETESKDRTSAFSDEEFYHLLQQFSNFLLHDFVDTIPIPRLQSLLEHCEQVRDRWMKEHALELDDTETEWEHHGLTNLQVLLYWLLDDCQQAAETARHEQHERPTDLVACTSLAFILRQTGDLTGAERQLTQLMRLRDHDPEQYATLEAKSLPSVLYLYKKCFYQVKPDALFERLENVLSKAPMESYIKVGIAMILRRSTEKGYMDQYPDEDFTKGLKRAIELFVELKDDTEVTASKRAVAAAELGGLFNRQRDEKLRKVADSEMADRQLTAAGCFEEALTLCPELPSVLTRAGRFFCFSNLAKSKELLEKALALRPDPHAQHHLGITLKKMAEQEIKRLQYDAPSKSSSQQQGWKTTHSLRQHTPYLAPQIPTEKRCKPPRFSRDDMYIEDAIHHFKAALDLCHGAIDAMSNSLGTLHRQLDEFEDALLLFMKVVDRCSTPVFLTGVLNELIMMYSRMSSMENDSTKRKALYQQKDSMMKAAVENQCQIQKHQQDTSFTSLTKLLSKIDSPGHTATPQPTMVWFNDKFPLLTSIRGIASCQIIRELRRFTEAQLSDAVQMERKIRMLLTEYRHDDAVLLLNLLTVTGQRPMMLTWKDADLYARSCVLAAGDRLWMCPVTSAERSLAKLFFRQAFNNIVSSMSHEGSGSGKVSCDQRTAKSLPGSEPPISPERADLQDAALADQTGTDPDGLGGRKWHVRVLHDPGDTKLRTEADGVTCVLRDVCGLTVTSKVTHPVSQMMTRTHVLVFIVTQTAISPGYAELMKQAATQVNPATHAPPSESAPSSATSGSPSRDPRDRMVALLLNGCPLPSALKGHRSFRCSPEFLEQALRDPGSKDGSNAVCTVFCSVLGIHM